MLGLCGVSLAYGSFWQGFSIVDEIKLRCPNAPQEFNHSIKEINMNILVILEIADDSTKGIISQDEKLLEANGGCAGGDSAADTLATALIENTSPIDWKPLEDICKEINSGEIPMPDKISKIAHYW